MRRAVAIGIGLLAVYAATLGLRADGASRYTSAEAHRLLVADALVHDGSVDVRGAYHRRAWRRWYPGELRPAGRLVGGRLLEPAGLGLPALAAPAYALGGPTLVELWFAALLAAAFAVSAGLARRLVPDPWATGAVVVCGLSPPALAASTTVGPAAPCALLVTAGAAVALSVREAPRTGRAVAGAGLLALTPWLWPPAAVIALVVGLAQQRWLRRRQRALAAFVAFDVALTSVVAWVAIDDRLYGGLTPASARLGSAPITGADGAGDAARRLVRLPGLLVDRDVGLVRWAPVVLLAGVGLWALWRGRRERLAVAVAEHVDAEVAAGLLAAVAAVAVALAVLVEPSGLGPWLVAPELVVALPCLSGLVAWGLRRAGGRRGIGAALVALTLVASAWTLVGARVDRAGTALAPPHGALPWGGMERVLPRLGR